MTIRSYILLLALGGCLATRAQEHPEKPFISPFDFPLTLSGNFGDINLVLCSLVDAVMVRVDDFYHAGTNGAIS